MPLFEYACRSCDRHFEYLTRAEQTPACPACGSIDLEKQFSTFAPSMGGSSSARFEGPACSPAGCGACGDPRGPGACGVN